MVGEILLYGSPVSVHDLAPDLTVLDYLREECRKCGTKEGCASGDCGACTVVVADVCTASDEAKCSPEGGLSYRSINACICFLKSIQGKQLITVEDLADADHLHPVQQALVDFHGSQCGFCTPGFVMSMFALYKNVESGFEHKPTDGDWVPLIERYLGGNLCRCTGYRPIVDACVHVLDQLTNAEIGPDKFTLSREQTIQAIAALSRNVESTSADGKFFLPESESQLQQALAANPHVRVLAGGTDLALEVTQQFRTLSNLICLSNLKELQQIEFDNNQCLIGAGVSLSQCMTSLCEWFPDLQPLLHRFGSTQIRNQATVGGNIANASPIGDLPPLLLALDAVVILNAHSGEREVPLNEFFLGYKSTAMNLGEYIRHVRVPQYSVFRENASAARLKIYKISKRLDDDISALCMAFNLRVQDNAIQSIKIGVGGMSAIPARATALEALLQGFQLTTQWHAQTQAQIMDAISQDFQPISDVRASAEYRTQVAVNLVRRLILELSGDDLVQVVHYG